MGHEKRWSGGKRDLRTKRPALDQTEIRAGRSENGPSAEMTPGSNHSVAVPVSGFAFGRK